MNADEFVLQDAVIDGLSSCPVWPSSIAWNSNPVLKRDATDYIHIVFDTPNTATVLREGIPLLGAKNEA